MSPEADGTQRTSQSTVPLFPLAALPCDPDVDEKLGGGVNCSPGLLGRMTVPSPVT